MPDDTGNKIIGQCNAGSTILARLGYRVTNADTLYTLTMLNRLSKKGEEECSISFPGNEKVVNELYTTIRRVISRRKRKHRDYTTTIVLSGKLVVLTATTVMGNRCVEIGLPQGNNILTDWQVDKIFGKT